MGEAAHHSNGSHSRHSNDEGHAHGHTGAPGTLDVIVGAALFVGLVFGLKPLLDSAVPGLLKEETLYHILTSGLIFFCVWGLIGNYVFAPYLKVLDERERRTVGDEKAATDRIRENKALLQTIEEQLTAARLEGIRERDQLVDEAKRQAAGVADAATEAAEQELAKARAQIESSKAAARAEIEREAAALASLVVERALEPAPEPLVH